MQLQKVARRRSTNVTRINRGKAKDVSEKSANDDLDFRAGSTFFFTKGFPRYYASPPGAKRRFCENCGSPFTYESECA